ncbi:hypothetical protein T492DRAFT_832329 [Pavlovales sp. CCMP2436]|nr:hypothetical protein T492DRAFT_832329 [Pavlovales sp. CCMP2436]
MWKNALNSLNSRTFHQKNELRQNGDDRAQRGKSEARVPTTLTRRTWRPDDPHPRTHCARAAPAADARLPLTAAHRDLALYDTEQCGTAGDAAAWLTLWSRLSRGLPITAFALGSSLVGVHGGCTTPAPVLNTSACRKLCPRCCGSRCGEWGDRGWARELLEWIKSHYPVIAGSGRHELFNLGEPGGDLIPAMIATADLRKDPYHKVETLLRHLLASRGRPTVVIVEFGKVQFVEHIASQADASLLPGGPRERRVAVGRAWNVGALPGGAAGVPPLERILSTLPKDKMLCSIQGAYDRVKVMHKLRSSYGLPLLSVVGCLGPLLGNRNVSLSFAQSRDGLHPTPRGSALICGALMAMARRGLAAAAAEAAASGSSEAGALVLPPPKVLRRVGLVCFTLDRAGVALSHNARRTPEETKAASVTRDKGVLPTIMPSSSGWRFVEFEPKSNTKYKPGLVAEQPGALLEMAIPAGIAGARQPSFVLQYLRSYVGHGIAEVSCTGGCACGAQRVDSHNPSEQTSTLGVLNLPFFEVAPARIKREKLADSAGALCLLRLRVLNETSSGAHKFKLVRMIVEVAPRRRRRLG